MEDTPIDSDRRRLFRVPWANRKHPDNYLRVRIGRGIVGTIFWLGLTILLWVIIIRLEAIFAANPTIVTIMKGIGFEFFYGRLVTIIGIFYIFFGYSIFKLIVVWFDGIVKDIFQIVALLILGMVVLAPVNGVVFNISFTSFTLQFSVFFTFLFLMALFGQLGILALDLWRFKVDQELDLKYPVDE